MAFLTEPNPERGMALPIVPGISGIVANNPSLMTYHGTNTYPIETEGSFVVLDPGPDDEGHLKDILTATQEQVSAIPVVIPMLNISALRWPSRQALEQRPTASI